MDLHVRPIRENDIPDLVELSLLAWAPVFDSMRQVLGPAIFALIWPEWRVSQREAVETVCQDEKITVLVAEAEGRAVGYVAYVLHEGDKTGEVYLLAVNPEYQNLGIGTELNRQALDEMRGKGMRMAKVETGGDPGHAPARRSYEKAGYTLMPIARYFKDL